MSAVGGGPLGYDAADAPRSSRAARMSDPRWPDDGPNWPEHDLQRQEIDGEPEAEPMPPSGDEWNEPPPVQGEPEGWERPFWEEPDPVPSAPPPADVEAPANVEPPAEEPPPITPSPILEAGEPTTAFAGSDDVPDGGALGGEDGAGGWDPRLDGDRRRPTTAEQAVPWMIGLILALAGIVIVLLALIFTFPGGLAASATPTPTVTPQPSLAPSGGVATSGEPSPSASPSPTEAATPGPSPTPAPVYGPLEMVYLGRPSALAPIYLLRRDFSKTADASVMAQADQGVGVFSWSPDGRVGTAIIAGRAVALEPGTSARALADDITALSFGWDSDTVYAVRITRAGANDRTEVLHIDFASGDAETLATITYPHPVTAPDAALKEAQFIDNGGLVRLFPMADGNLALWVLGAPATYRIDAGDGRVTEIGGQPTLWAPDGKQRVALTENANGSTVIRLLDEDGEEASTTTVTGLVSHVRWAGTNNEIVFTLGRLGNSGGVRQDLYVWDLTDAAPMALTSNGVSFGAEWLGVAPNWLP